MKKKLIWVVVIIAIITGVIGLRIAAINRSKYVHVKAEGATKGNLYAYLSTSGTVESEIVKNYYGVQGKVKDIYVNVGDKVENGTALAKYEVQDLNAMVKQATLQYENAKLSYEELKRQKDNEKKTSNKANTQGTNTVTGTDQQALQQLLGGSQGQSTTISEERLKQAKNSVSLAKISLETAKENLRKIKDKITSEISGVVTKINITEGAMDSGMQPAIIIQDLNKLRIVTNVGRFDSYKIKVGQSVVIRNNEKTYKGIVNFIDPVANKEVSMTGSDTNMSVKIKVLTGIKELKVGFDTDIDILFAAATNATKIPAECVKTDKSGKAFVFVVEGEKALQREVILGIQSDTEVEVKNGLAVGEKVILNPSTNISDGTLIKVDTEVAK